MAKASWVNAIERHAEKGILALCALFLLYSLVHWVFSSPRQVSVANQVVAPDEVDRSLLDLANRVKALNDNARPRSKRPRDYTQEMQEIRSAALPEGITMGLSSPRPPVTLPGNVETDKLELRVDDFKEIMPKPKAPKVWAGRELLQSGDEPTDVVAAHIAVVYPWDQLAEAWNEKLKNSIIKLNLIVLKVITERQEQLPDGSWSPAKQIKTVSVPLVDGSGRKLTMPVVLPYNGRNADEVRRTLDELAGDYWQQNIIEPEYWDVWWPTGQWGSWQIHLPRTEVSESAAEEDVSKVRRKPSRSRVPTTPTDWRRTGNVIPPATRTTKRRPSGAGGLPMDMMVPSREDIEAMRKKSRQPAPRTRVKTPKPAVAKPATPHTPVEAPKVTPVPDLYEQMQQGKVLAWQHDNSVQNLKVYRYRVRLVFVSPLLACDEDVKSSADARLLSLETPPSDFSEPVVVPKATEFFLAGSNPAQRAVRVIVFTHSLGQRVKASFNITPGRPIGRTQQVSVTNPMDGDLEKRTADFSTGAIAVDFDFKKRVRQGNMSRPTVEMLYLDERGRLRKRLLVEDKESERFKKLSNETRQ
ncbi:MAG: hypothetical protein SVT52_09360 [Planctomycetota bacterium]|nr:hypothetical protein [Planctomycetota bacterium]